MFQLFLWTFQNKRLKKEGGKKTKKNLHYLWGGTQNHSQGLVSPSRVESSTEQVSLWNPGTPGSLQSFRMAEERSREGSLGYTPYHEQP